MYFLRCAGYLAIISILAFPLGRLTTGHKFNYEARPFRQLGFEKDGKIYKRIGIAAWQSHVPDMSRVFKRFMPEKKLSGRPDRQTLMVMIQETCIAEMTHSLLCLAALPSLWIWPGLGGIVVWLIYCLLGNVPFILIQRYNRPRLVRLLRHCRTGEER